MFKTTDDNCMHSYIQHPFTWLLTCFTIILFSSCTSWETPVDIVEAVPVIFPDYKEVTVPCNIAPLNFMVEGTDRIQTSFSLDGNEKLKVAGEEGVIRIPLKKWQALMEQSAGSTLEVSVSVWSDEHPDGLAYKSFKVNVAEDKMDPWISYRLIEPGYVGWRQLGIYQREVSSFDERPIVTNRESNTTCINCHHYSSYSPESMMFHARGTNGGTIIYHDGDLRKIDFKNIGPKMNATYPAWHPDGRFIAFSSNNTHQVFYGESRQPVEVYDTASDLILYDVRTGEVLTDPRFMTDDFMETFPAWSPDGRYLYYVAAPQKNLPGNIKETHYSLYRVSFNMEDGSFGDDVQLIYDADANGGSISYPRISAGGRYLLYTWSEYGTFPVWHAEADLKMIDLNSMEPVDVSVWNHESEADSYHSWSSDGRWVIFGSRRIDGRYTRLYVAYLDKDGNPRKPFLLPQEDPRYNMWRLKSYNVPEFLAGKVELPDGAAELFCSEQ